MQDLKIGDTVSVPLWGPTRHVGMIVEVGVLGQPTMIRSVNPGKGTPVEQTLAEFAEGKPVRHHKHQGPLNRKQTVTNARAVRQFDYNFLTNNCEHFCRRAAGLSNISPQVALGCVALATVGLCMAITRKVSLRA